MQFIQTDSQQYGHSMKKTEIDIFCVILFHYAHKAVFLARLAQRKKS